MGLKPFSSLNPANPGRFETQISRLAFAGARTTCVVQTADLQRFFAWFATPAYAFYLHAAGAGLGAPEKLEAAVGLLETLTPAQRASVKAVAINMWLAYMSATRQCMPQADIVHDKFHVSEYLGEAVDAVRKHEHRSLSRAGSSALTGSKWAWLQKYPDGRSAEAVAFRALNQLNLKTSRA